MDLHKRAVAAVVRFANGGNGAYPVEYPFGFFGAHVDTAVAHRGTKIVVPISAVKGMTLCCEETCPGNAGQLVIVKTRKEIAVAHVFGRHFIQDVKFAFRGFG